MLGNGIEYILGNHLADGNAKEMIVVLPNMFAAPAGSKPALSDEGLKGYDNFVNDLTANKFGYVGAMCPAPGVTPGRDQFMNHPGQLREDQFKVSNHAYDPYVLMIAAGTNDNVVGTFPKQYHNILTLF